MSDFDSATTTDMVLTELIYCQKLWHRKPKLETNLTYNFRCNRSHVLQRNEITLKTQLFNDFKRSQAKTYYIKRSTWKKNTYPFYLNKKHSKEMRKLCKPQWLFYK
uniref:Uncharacterized protein n=1 Tax=Cacopsylla melanoneura TaxID=428564 RepID=A0A8D8TI28_9HEMI